MVENSEQTERTPQDILLDKAREERALLNRENERMERNIARMQELETTRLLAGTAGGRMHDEVMSEEEKRKQESLNFWRGTSIADAIEKVK